MTEISVYNNTTAGLSNMSRIRKTRLYYHCASQSMDHSSAEREEREAQRRGERKGVANPVWTGIGWVHPLRYAVIFSTGDSAALPSGYLDVRHQKDTSLACGESII